MVDEIKFKVEELLALLDILLSKDKSQAYWHIKKIYVNFLDTINKKEKIETDDFLIIQNCMRMFLESPSSDMKLGITILDKMQEIYDIEELID